MELKNLSLEELKERFNKKFRKIESGEEDYNEEFNELRKALRDKQIEASGSDGDEIPM